MQWMSWGGTPFILRHAPKPNLMKHSTSMPMMPLSLWNHEEQTHVACSAWIGLSLGANAASFLAKRSTECWLEMIVGLCDDIWYHPGQIIFATSHDRFPPNGGLFQGNPRKFQGNLGWWNIIIWPGYHPKKTVVSRAAYNSTSHPGCSKTLSETYLFIRPFITP